MILMLVAEQSLSSGDEGQQTVTAQKKGSSEQIEVYNLIVLSPEPSLTLQGWPVRDGPPSGGLSLVIRGRGKVFSF